MTVQATVSLGGGSLGPAERGGRSTAEPPLIDSTRMLLVREDHDGRPGPFRLLDFGAGDVRPQTPEEALRLLLLAAEQRSYAAVMRLLSPAQRRVVEAELNERIDRLRAALSRNQPIEVRGERARFQYDPRFYIDLQKDPDSEGAAWRVLDLN